MSVTGLMAARGSKVTIRRSVKTHKASDGTYNQSLTTIAADVAVILQEVAAGMAQKLWGQETKATVRAWFPAGQDVQGQDIITVSAGNLTGQHYQVDGGKPHIMTPGSQHKELGLILTQQPNV